MILHFALLIVLAQSAAEYAPTLTGAGSLGISGVVLYLWNQQRKDYLALSQDFRKIVQENTQAIAANAAATLALRDVLESNKFCPLAEAAEVHVEARARKQ